MKRLIIIGAPTAFNHPCDYLKQTVLYLARQENIVVVVSWKDASSFKELLLGKNYTKYFFQSNDNLNVYFFNPIHFLPFIRFRIVKNINLFINILFLFLIILNKKWDKYKKYLWIFHHSYYNFPKFFNKSWVTLYDCVEYPFSHNPTIEKQIRLEEKQLIDSVKYFFVNSPTLKNIWLDKDPVVVKQGFDLRTFMNSAKENKYVCKIPNNKKVIGYIGGINYRLDYKLLDIIIQKNPQLNFVFMGIRENYPNEDIFTNTDYWINRIHTYKNVFFINGKPREYVPQMIKRFDICLIPYNTKNKFNYNSMTMKTYEYFYFGKPVISTPLLESLRLSPPMFIAKNERSFSKTVEEIFKNGLPTSYAKKEKLLAIENSWESKIGEVCKYIFS